MLLPVITNVEDVGRYRLCSGCGACAAISPGRIEIIDDPDHGRRPVFVNGRPNSEEARRQMAVCPGVGIDLGAGNSPHRGITELAPAWGRVLELWEGHATDPAIRHAGSSGGVASALSIACIEALAHHGVLHIAPRADRPLINGPVLSTSRRGVLAAGGSRYAPAGPCERLDLIADAPGSCVFIGKPCDIAAASKARSIWPSLDANLALSIAIFCAGAPTRRANEALMRKLGVDDPASVIDLRYRGRGWPGRTEVTSRTGHGWRTRSMSYEEAWGGILTNSKPWRCHVCADHSGELADISVADAWHRRGAGDDPGQSIILVRTERGRAMLHAAMAAGYLTLKRAEPSSLAAGQGGLLRARAATWGRIVACRWLGVAAPRYRGAPLVRLWWAVLTPAEKARSILGAVKRIVRRRLHRSLPVRPTNAITVFGSQLEHDGPAQRDTTQRNAARRAA